MRTLLFGLFASSSLALAAPAVADPGEGGDAPNVELSRDEPVRAEPREDYRPDAGRGERGGGWQAREVQRAERVERAPEPAPVVVQSVERPVQEERRPEMREVARDIERGERAERVEPAEQASTIRMVEPPVTAERRRPQIRDVARDIEGAREGRDSVRDWRRAERERRWAPEEQVEAQPGDPGPRIVTPPPPIPDQRWGDRRRDRDARNPGFDVLKDRVASEGWRRDWRRDRRHDWRSHRDRNRHLFRWGFYYDPFGWNYRPWHIGRFIYPRYFSSRYWIRDPWRYRLPPVYGPYRWIRYYDDALLVDLRTGRVVDVIRRFFW